MTRRSLLLAAAALSLFSGPVAADSLKLRIATEGAFAPWNATTADGKIVGFEVDLVHDLCRRMEAECEVVAQDWDGILPGLQQGRYDAVIAGVSITPERERVVDFSAAYAADPAMFAVQHGSPLGGAFPVIARIDLAAGDGQPGVAAMAKALEGKTVAVQVNTIHERMVEALFPAARVRAYEKLDYAALDLAAGRVDALLGNRSALEAIMKADGRVAVAGPTFSRGALGAGVGVAVRKGNPLAARFTQAIASAGEDGTASRLSAQWFGYDVSVR
ncbi:transporter substrate-binding domain-containing protein [Azospirillum sp. B510]|uniref:transporter substrate-binding domain-containing protein n=1 Tax=Azospirillum sp. (strain B510) TaxID=137722 RepID=UPI00031D94C8|nr:transporter substrate-binding domain-containing protein [Azospirillum sp. B510]